MSLILPPSSVSMASSELYRNSINAHKHQSMIAFDHAKHVTNSHPAKSILMGRQPKKLKIINSQRNDTLPRLFQVDEYKALKAKQINKALDEAVPLRHPAILHEAMRYSLIPGGKRFMSTLCIASCELVGGSESVAMSLACAIEMLSTMGTIQDDLPCFDNDDLRRGKPSNHKVFGEATTILACQALHCLAVEQIAMMKTKNVSPDRLLRAIVEMSSAIGSEGLAAGQIMDISSEGKDVSLSELNFIHRHKSEKFVEASIVSGVIIGGGNEEEIERMRNYGKCVGMAYQLWNDIVDVIGSPETKETTGRDMLRGKATYPKLVGIDESKNYAKELLAKAKQELAYFDPAKAAPLDHLVNFMVSFDNVN
ncbi:Heterodimeric geranylgeranyl pyrophosphate synthase large subunit 1 [Citrus sinensis]|nr:geranylgeranyl pyrophosphate synthase, chloroplastic-like [Citrus sinensis]KAH9685471.1 Heterodimeric geranylgeranyl pyrophosphate synthase large subunit 1 [Citrus sinensis]